MRSLLLILLCFSLPIFAQDPSLDELMEGFEETTPADAGESVEQLLENFDDAPISEKTSTEETAAADWYQFSGYTTLGSSYNYQHSAPAANEADFRGLSRLRLSIQPEFSVDLPNKWQAFASARGFYDFAYELNGRDQYTATYLDHYETEAELREAYLLGSLRHDVDIKFGRQIVVWGKSDSIRVVDILNPLDFREPGMVDIEALRLPVTMLKVDYYSGNWNLTAIAIPEIRFNKMPVFGSDYFPGDKTVPEEVPDSSLENVEYALALSGIFSGWDISFHLADVYSDQAYFIKGQNGPKLQKHSRIQMLGAASNIAMGNWLIKGELARFNGNQFANVTSRDFARIDLMMGIDYSGITNHTLSLEGLVNKILEYDAKLDAGPDNTNEYENQIAFRYTGNFLREKLQLVFLASLFGVDEDTGGFYRVSADYELAQAISVSGGVVAYQAGDSELLKAVASNDRFFAELRYDF